MARLLNQDFDLLAYDYYNFDMPDFDDYPFLVDESPRSGSDVADDLLYSDFEDEFDGQSKAKTDTSASEARNGKDIQGIPWERMSCSRDKLRHCRLKLFNNYESLSQPREELEKKCKRVEKGHSFYAFQFNTRLIKSTILHFQYDVL